MIPDQGTKARKAERASRPSASAPPIEDLDQPPVRKGGAGGVPEIERIPPVPKRRRHAPRVLTSLALVLTVLVLSPYAGFVWSWWSAAPSGPGGWLRYVAAALLVGLVGTMLWRAGLYRTLISLPFSVALLSVLLVVTALGTVVLQGGAPEEYAERYGELSPVFLHLGLNDLFHTAWFNGLLVLLTVSLMLVGTRRAVWRVSMVGHMFCHLGVVAVLAGGFVGKLWGYRGVIDAHEGESFAEAWTTDRGVPTGDRHALGFTLRLNDFEIERYEPEFRLYAYAREGESFVRTNSFGIEDAQDWTNLGEDFAFRIRAAYPDFYVLAELREAPPEEGVPALSLRGPDDVELRLLAGVAGRDAAFVDGGKTLLRLVEQAPDAAELERLASAAPEGHKVTFLDPETAEERTLMVRPGESYTLAAGIQLRVVDYLPDFVFDMETKSAQSRSAEPNNPALSVVVTDEGGTEPESWLFANMPDYGDAHGEAEEGLRLVYSYDPPSQPIPREILVVAEERQIWKLENGLVGERSALASEGTALAGLSEASFRFFDSAIERREAATRSEEWSNPTLEVEYRHDGHVATQFFSAEHGDPLWLPDGENVMTFEPKANDVKAYRSQVEVLVDGSSVRADTIEVNTPLSFGGYHIYQSNYREEDPTYSGFLVVKDPGFKVVFLGFVMMSLGVIFVYYIRPRLVHGVLS